MLGTFAAMITTTLASYVPGDTEFAKLALAAGVVGTAAYAIGLLASFWLPEPGEAQLPE